METEINEGEGGMLSLKKVTPLSKYFAMLLFISMPFIGGWIGYTYAPEKLVEVEKIVIKEAPTPQVVDTNQTQITEMQTNSQMIVDPDIAKVGDTFGNFTITNITNDDLMGTYITFSGTVVVTGTIYPREMLGPGIALDEASAKIFPSIKLGDEIVKPYGFDIEGSLVGTLPSEAIDYMDGKNPKYTITAEIKDYRFVRAPKEAVPTAELVRIIDLKKN